MEIKIKKQKINKTKKCPSKENKEKNSLERGLP